VVVVGDMGATVAQPVVNSVPAMAQRARYFLIAE
jgi:hypothetical protein